MSAGLSKQERICSRKAISQIMASGRYVAAENLRCCFLRRNDGDPLDRMMVSVPKRFFKRAVRRNLLKRRIREAYRLQKGIIEGAGADMMFIYSGKEVADFNEIYRSVGRILEQISGK